MGQLYILFDEMGIQERAINLNVLLRVPVLQFLSHSLSHSLCHSLSPYPSFSLSHSPLLWESLSFSIEHRHTLSNSFTFLSHSLNLEVSLSHTHKHRFSQSSCLFFPHFRTLSLRVSHSLSNYVYLSFSLCLSLSHTHTYTHNTHPLRVTLSLFVLLCVFLSLSHKISQKNS